MPMQINPGEDCPSPFTNVASKVLIVYAALFQDVAQLNQAVIHIYGPSNSPLSVDIMPQALFKLAYDRIVLRPKIRPLFWPKIRFGFGDQELPNLVISVFGQNS